MYGAGYFNEVPAKCRAARQGGPRVYRKEQQRVHRTVVQSRESKNSPCLKRVLLLLRHVNSHLSILQHTMA